MKKIRSYFRTLFLGIFIGVKVWPLIGKILKDTVDRIFIPEGHHPSYQYYPHVYDRFHFSSWDTLKFSSCTKAQKALDEMKHEIRVYGYLTIADAKRIYRENKDNMLPIPFVEPDDYRYGWRSLSYATVSYRSDSYFHIIMPAAIGLGTDN